MRRKQGRVQRGDVRVRERQTDRQAEAKHLGVPSESSARQDRIEQNSDTIKQNTILHTVEAYNTILHSLI